MTSQPLLDRVVAGALFAAVFAYLAACVFRVPWSGDALMYVAGLHSLTEEGASPLHESLVAPAQYSYAFTPYLRAWAGLGALAGASGYRVLQSAGVLNLVLYLAAVVAYFRALLPQGRPLAAASLFLITSLCLRSQNYCWSSETSLRSLALIQSYPSFFAWAAALAAFACFERYLGEGGRRRLVAVVCLVGAALLVHPLTGSWVLGIGVLRCLVASGAEPRRRLWLAAAILAALLLGLAAPGSLLLRGDVMAIREDPPFLKRPFAGFELVYAFAALGAASELARRRVPFPLLGCLASLGVYALGTRAGIDLVARYVFFAAFFAQVQAALLAVACLEAARRRVLALSVPVLLVGACLASPMLRGGAGIKCLLYTPAALWRAAPSEAAFYAQLGTLRPFLGRGDVVLCTDLQLATVLFPLSGAKAMASHLMYQLPDRDARREALTAFLERDTAPEARAAMIERYGLTRLLLVKPTPQDVELFTNAFGRPIAHSERLVLFSTAP